MDKPESEDSVVNAVYSDSTGVITGKCPHCGDYVQRVWNLKCCGNCGRPISWNGIPVENYHDLPQE
ncbi:hypothetical protein [Lachnospira intestinalis]|uniref:Uncharacterized protein n=1 Tax=Lachnospira intestinalis TaxID=3133158 RepID=A0ABV1H578_9FIRM